MPEETFIISFDYTLEEYGKIIRLEAVAEPAASRPCLLVHSFRRHSNKDTGSHTTVTHILPPIEIRHVEKAGKRVWVHHDSEKESRLSSLIGKAIEEKQYIPFDTRS
jgi:hypothetical protein